MSEDFIFNLGKFSIFGNLIEDNVCINSTGSCASDFKFVGIIEQEGIDGLDGILGLSPDDT